jgi:hypothetical protein
VQHWLIMATARWIYVDRKLLKWVHRLIAQSAWPSPPRVAAQVAQPLALAVPQVVVQQAARLVEPVVRQEALQVVRLAQAVRRLVELRPVELPPRVVPLPLPQVALQAWVWRALWPPVRQ